MPASSVANHVRSRCRERSTADKIFLDVGGRPLVPKLKGVEDGPYLTNQSIMDVDFVPEHLIVVGGSYIGLEFGQMFRRFGSRVTVVEMAPAAHRARGRGRVAGGQGDFRSRRHRRAPEAECLVSGKKRQRLRVGLDCTEGAPRIAGTHVLLAVGRVPNTDDLGLEAAGIALDKRGYVEVDEALRTTNPKSGRWATATARAPSPTPRRTITRSSPTTCSRAPTASGPTASRCTRSTPIRRSAASA